MIKEDIITTDKYLSLTNKSIVYIKTGLLKMNYRGHLYGKIWITGHSDYSIDTDIYNKYQHHCQYWFTVNKNSKKDNLFALPLGITNDSGESTLHAIYGNLDIMMYVMNKPREIKNVVYMNFSIHTYPQERQYCYDLFKDNPWVTKGTTVQTIIGRTRFLTELRNHLFVLCPRGNGIDTHRLWETLYMGSIPIVIKTIALEEFSDLPILFVDKWTIVNEDFLKKKYQEIRSKTWNMEKLKFSYWKNKITNII